MLDLVQARALRKKLQTTDACICKNNNMWYRSFTCISSTCVCVYLCTSIVKDFLSAVRPSSPLAQVKVGHDLVGFFPMLSELIVGLPRRLGGSSGAPRLEVYINKAQGGMDESMQQK